MLDRFCDKEERHLEPRKPKQASEMGSSRGGHVRRKRNGLSTGSIPPARQARLATGLSLKALARKAGISASYLRYLETSGSAPLHTAIRLGKIVKCSPAYFLYKPSYFEEARKPGEAACSDAGCTAEVETDQVRARRRLSDPQKSPILTLVRGGEAQAE